MPQILAKIKVLMSNKYKKGQGKGSSFFDLSTSEKAKIIKKATRKANEDQKRLVDEFDRSYCQSKCN